MPSRARVRRSKRAGTPVEAKTDGKLSVGVHVAACLERKIPNNRYGESRAPEYPGKSVLEYQSFLEKLYIDQYGNLVANAGCTNGVFCFSKDEVPRLLEFCQQLINGFEK